MPDLISHGLIAYAARRPLRLTRYTGALMLGTAMPDLLSRFAQKTLGDIYFFTGWFPGPQLTWFWAPLHTPFTLALICWAFALLFEERLRKGVLAALLAGMLLHLGLDSFQAHYGGGELMLFPFSWVRFEKGLIGPETSVEWLPALAVGVVALEMAWRLLGGRMDRGRRREDPDSAPGGQDLPREIGRG